jgi:DNA-binding MarR family transcriptional regulator
MLVLLEGRGLVARGRHPTDGRARSVALTKKGRRTLAKLWAAVGTFRDRMLAAFRPDEVDTLFDFLGRITRVSAPSEQRRPRRRPAPAARNGKSS